MKQILLVATILVLSIAHASTLVIENVTLRDPASESPATPQHVVIRDGAIRAIGLEVPIPPTARRIDGRGKFLIPGLVDMHVHLEHLPDSYPALLARHGVTLVRDMGGDALAVQELQRRIDNGELTGPKIVYGGPQVVHGLATAQNRLPMQTPGEARTMVDVAAALGVNFMVTLDVDDGALLESLERYAKQRGLVLFPEHDARIPGFVARRPAEPEKVDPRDRFVPSFMQRFWANPPAISPEAPIADPAELMTGTSLGAPRIYPGSSLHEELELLVAHGLEPRQALAAATTRPRRALGFEEAAIVIDQPADLVLLTADPYASIANVRKIEGVVRAGRWLDLERLTAIDTWAEGVRDASTQRETVHDFYKMRHEQLRDRESGILLARYYFSRGEYLQTITLLETARATYGKRGETRRRVRKRDPAREIGMEKPVARTRRVDELILAAELNRRSGPCESFHDEADALLAMDANDPDGTVDLIERIRRAATRRGCPESWQRHGARLASIDRERLDAASLPLYLAAMAAWSEVDGDPSTAEKLRAELHALEGRDPEQP